MSLPPGITRKLPLVFADRRAVEQARELGIVRPLENVVYELIVDGGIVRRERRRNIAVVIGRGLEVVMRRTAAPGSGRDAWLVTEVQARRKVAA